MFSELKVLKVLHVCSVEDITWPCWGTNVSSSNVGNMPDKWKIKFVSPSSQQHVMLCLLYWNR